MVALTETGDFGYAEKKLADDRYEITYTTPRLRTSTHSDSRAEDVQVEKDRAHDLAVWRAAQLGQQLGFTAFKIEQDNRDADVTVRQDADPFYDYGPSPFFYRRFGPWPYYYGYPYGGGYGYGYRSEASARVTSKLVVQFLREPTDDSLDVAETAKTLSSQYASATYPGDSY
jgi:hypothetical protein